MERDKQVTMWSVAAGVRAGWFTVELQETAKRYWCAEICMCVCVSHDTSLTAMADLTAWSWKATLAPSSGLAVLSWSLVIPRSCLPFSTPRLLTVLHRHKTQNPTSCNTSPITVQTSHCSRSVCALVHSHSGETFILQPGSDFTRWGAHVQSHWAARVALWGRVNEIKCYM